MMRRDLILYVRDLGWRDLDVGQSAAGQDPDAPVIAPERAAADSPSPTTAEPLGAASLAEMKACLVDCRRCRLADGRTQVVFGAGHDHARVVFVGEGPGADEDRVGEPFVGRAGQLLNAMLRAIDLRREDVYIANVVKCRPPGNRDPEDDEAAACLPFLWRQIDLIDPAVVVTLGRIASRHVLGYKGPIMLYRGRWTTWRGRDVLPTLHPAFLLRNPTAKSLAWADLKSLRHRLASI